MEPSGTKPGPQLASCLRFLKPLRQTRASERHVFVYGGARSSAGDYDTLFCLHRGTGAVRWKLGGGQDAGGAALSPLFVGEGKVFVCTEDGLLHAIEEQSGASLWTFAHESLLAFPVGLLTEMTAVREPRPTADAEALALPSGDHPYRQTPALYHAPARSSLCVTDAQGRILELSAQSGSLSREGKIGAQLAAGCVEGDTLWLLGMDDTLSCLDAQTWKERWQRPFINLKDGLLLLTESALILQERDNTLSAFSQQSGHPLWMSTLSCDHLILPSPSAQKLFALSRSGALLTIDLSSGGSQMLASCPGASSITAAGGSLYVDYPGEIGAYDAATGVRGGGIPAPGVPRNALFAEGDQLFAFREEGDALFLYAAPLSPRLPAWKSRV